MISLINVNTIAIDQLCHLLGQLNNANYSQPLNVLHNNTIGKHVRHVTEFYQTFLQGLATGIVDYDNRQRNIRLETEIAFTIEQLTQIKTTLQHIAYNTPLQLSVAYTQDATRAATRSARARNAPAAASPRPPSRAPGRTAYRAVSNSPTRSADTRSLADATTATRHGSTSPANAPADRDRETGLCSPDDLLPAGHPASAG